MLAEQYEEEKNRLLEAARLLEEVNEKNAKANEDKENEYLAQIEDLNAQV